MSKVFRQFSVLVLLFFGMWFTLSKFDFVRAFEVEEFTKSNERRLGRLVLDGLYSENSALQSDSVLSFVRGIQARLCAANDIPDSTITLHILIRGDVNAFALPDRQLVVYTGLISYCKNAEEFAGVLAHEIAHIERGHVMKKLVTHVGISMLMTIAGGDAGPDISRQIVTLLSSTAFDREQENEADAFAVKMMAGANIDPEHFANFLFRLSQEKNTIPKHFEWISTHTNSQERASEVLRLKKSERFDSLAIADTAAWASIKRSMRDF